MAEERSHLMRQKAICDQRIFNLLKQAEEQGVKGLVPGDDDEAATDSDNVSFIRGLTRFYHWADRERFHSKLLCEMLVSKIFAMLRLFVV